MTSSVEDTALKLAAVMGREALSLARRMPHSMDAKADAFDLVTSVDREIESNLRRRIGERFPDHAILGEEQGLDGRAGEWTWVLDPIDGTLNFATGLPIAACSIALLQGERIRVAAVADLATDTVFSARAGSGIQSDRGPIAVKQGVDDPGRARLFLDHSPEAPAPELLEALWALAEVAPVVPRMIGSAAVALLAVSIGGGSFAGVGLRLWDVAAGILLAEECGRTVRRWHGDGAHVMHVLAGDESSVDRLEPAMLHLIDCWRTLEAPRLRVAPGP